MAKRRTVEQSGKKFDFDRVLANVPEADVTARTTEAAVAAGDVIRRVRNRKAISQVTLAKRIGTTQPHLSEIERGLGESGPTVGTLSKLLHALDDELIIQSRTEHALWMAEQIDAAEAAVGEITERLGREAIVNESNLTTVMAQLSKVNKAERNNPFKNTLLNGLILGIYLALRARSGSDQNATAKRIVEDTLENRFSSLFHRPDTDVNATN